MATKELKFICPVCSYPELTEAPAECHYNICPQCGVEFGYDDPVHFPAIREAWDKAGKPFWQTDANWQNELERLVG